MLFPPARLSPIAISIIIACCPSVATAGFRALEDGSGKAQGPSRASTIEPRYSPIPNVVLSFHARSNRLTADAQTGLLEFVRHGATNASYVIVVKGDRSMGASLISARVATTRQALIDAGVDPSRFTLGVTADYEDDLPAPYVRVFLAPAQAVQSVTSTRIGNNTASGEPTGRMSPNTAAASALSSADVQVEIASRIIAISQSGKLEPQTALMLMQNFLGPQGQRIERADEARPDRAQPATVGSRPAEVAPHWRNADGFSASVPIPRPQQQQAQSQSQRVSQASQPLPAALPIARESANAAASSQRTQNARPEVAQPQSATASTFRLAPTSESDVTAAFARAPMPSVASRVDLPPEPTAQASVPGNASAASFDSIEKFFGIATAPKRHEGFSTARYVVVGPAFSFPASVEQPNERILAPVPEGTVAAPATALPIAVASMAIPNVPLAINDRTGPQVSRDTPPPAGDEARAATRKPTLTVHPGVRLAGEVALADYPSGAPGAIAVAAAIRTASSSGAAPGAVGAHVGVESDGTRTAISDVAQKEASPASPTWHLDAEKTLRDNLEAWATTAGYRLKWDASNYIQVVTPRTYSTDFLSVVKSVGQAVASLVHIQAYPDANPPEIRVSDATQ